MLRLLLKLTGFGLLVAAAHFWVCPSPRATQAMDDQQSLRILAAARGGR